MRIGYFTPSYPGVTGDGGLGTHTRAMAEQLAKWGHEVDVVTSGPRPATVQAGPIAVHVIDTAYHRVLDRVVPGAGASCRLFAAMSALVRRRRLDIVEFKNWEGFGCLFSSWRSVPLVVRLSTSSLETQSIDGIPATRAARWDVRRELWMARHADALVTHSEAHRQRMIEELRVPTGLIDLSPHGTRTFPDYVRPKRQPGPLRVVYLGRMEKRKGTLDLLHAIPQVLHQVPESRFIFIGADRPHCPGGLTHAEYIRSKFSDDVRSRMALLGRLPDDEIDGWLQTADLFVAPSLYESFGLIFLEAMRWGTPVIGTTAGGIPEIITHNQSGVLVPPQNANALATAVVELLQDEPRRLALGTAGRLRVETVFSVEQMARRAERLYGRTIAAYRGMSRHTTRSPESNGSPVGPLAAAVKSG